jgi:hypothetical protein
MHARPALDVSQEVSDALAVWGFTATAWACASGADDSFATHTLAPAPNHPGSLPRCTCA